MTKYFAHVAFEQGGEQRVHGPFDSYALAHEFAKPFAEEGLDVEIRTSDPICDFCSIHEVAWSYPAMDFGVVDPAVGWGSRGGWAACLPCHEMIEANDRTGLANRSIDMYYIQHPETPDLPEVRQHIRNHIRLMHESFFNVRTGPGKAGIDPDIL